jgi:hypothetical protein
MSQQTEADRPQSDLSAEDRHAVVVGVLKAKIAELEKALVKDSFTSARSSLDYERTLAELQTTRKNYDIQTQNVETLKGVALHLAGQLEEANIRLATLEEKQKVKALRLESGLTQEMAAVRQQYEQRLDDLRQALRTQEDAASRQAALLEAREDQALRRLAALERAKDNTIRELSHEVEVLRAGLAMRPDRPSKVGSEPLVRGASAAAPWLSPLGPRHPGQDSRGGVGVIGLSVAMSHKDAETARFARGIPMSGTPSSIVVADPTLDVDVTADPSVVQPVDLPPSGRVGTHRWGFEMPSGQQVMITVEIV